MSTGSSMRIQPCSRTLNYGFASPQFRLSGLDCSARSSSHQLQVWAASFTHADGAAAGLLLSSTGSALLRKGKSMSLYELLVKFARYKPGCPEPLLNLWAPVAVLFQLDGVGLYGVRHKFEKPWFTTWESAVACWACLALIGFHQVWHRWQQHRALHGSSSKGVREPLLDLADGAGEVSLQASLSQRQKALLLTHRKAFWHPCTHQVQGSIPESLCSKRQVEAC